jgi:hypothetical protein
MSGSNSRTPSPATSLLIRNNRNKPVTARKNRRLTIRNTPPLLRMSKTEKTRMAPALLRLLRMKRGD